MFIKTMFDRWILLVNHLFALNLIITEIKIHHNLYLLLSRELFSTAAEVEEKKKTKRRSCFAYITHCIVKCTCS